MSSNGQMKSNMIRHPNVDRLIEFLDKVDEGDMVSYSDIKDIIKKNPQGEGRSWLEAAKRAMLSRQKVFETIRCAGLKRMTNTEIATKVYNKDRKAIQRRSTRALKKQTTVVVDKLEPNERRGHTMALAVLGVAAKLCRADTATALLSSKANPTTPNTGRLIEFLQGK